MDNTGCSDVESVVCSEFSSTPDTSTESTPESSPTKKRKVDEPTPTISKGPAGTKGKNLTLLMKGRPTKYALPKESLYFSEMARHKMTARKKTGKTPRKQLATKAPQKTLSKEAARKVAAQAMAAAQKNLGNPRTGGLKRPVRWRPGHGGPSRDP